MHPSGTIKNNRQKNNSSTVYSWGGRSPWLWGKSLAFIREPYPPTPQPPDIVKGRNIII